VEFQARVEAQERAAKTITQFDFTHLIERPSMEFNQNDSRDIRTGPEQAQLVRLEAIPEERVTAEHAHEEERIPGEAAAPAITAAAIHAAEYARFRREVENDADDLFND